MCQYNIINIIEISQNNSVTVTTIHIFGNFTAAEYINKKRINKVNTLYKDWKQDSV